MDPYEERMPRTQWFREDRFGMFIHWGLFSIPARGAWQKNQERMTNEEYQIYFDEFNPDKFKPKVWARTAKSAGQKYAVLTSKNHDGFCLFDSRLTDYKAPNTPAGRDLVKEYVEAFREEGLKIGFYYSLLDWHHEDYPAYSDAKHPMRGNEAYKDKEYDFSRYLAYMHGQVKELVSNYGKIDLLFLDYSYEDMKGEMWEATKLVEMIRSLQPEILINNRLGGNILAAGPEAYAGDFYTPEQIIPEEGIVNDDGMPIPWETCLTMNENWSYSSADKNFKSPRQLLRDLVECTSKNGNLLLNVGPDARGYIPEESIDILAQIGKWMDKNCESIYGCGKSEMKKPEWGIYTQKGKMLYAHIFDAGTGLIRFGNMRSKIKRARILANGSEVQLINPSITSHYPNDSFMNMHLLDKYDLPVVIKLELY